MGGEWGGVGCGGGERGVCVCVCMCACVCVCVCVVVSVEGGGGGTRKRSCRRSIHWRGDLMRLLMRCGEWYTRGKSFRLNRKLRLPRSGAGPTAAISTTRRSYSCGVHRVGRAQHVSACRLEYGEDLMPIAGEDNWHMLGGKRQCGG